MAKIVRDIRLPYALREDRLVHVDSVPTGNRCGCVCPNCRERLIAKNAGKVRAHHFSHVGASGSCGEGWLHATAKLLLVERITQAQGVGLQVPLAYKCRELPCDCTHHGDLLRGVAEMEVEASRGSIRPDIYLGGLHPKVVEIVVTHEPDAVVRQYTETNDILLVVLHVNSEADLESIKGGTLTPDVRFCPCVAKVRAGEPVPCGWRWCDRCREPVEDMQGQYGGYGDHRHCASCGDLMVWTKGGYPKHYCCWLTDRFGLPRCEDRNPDHPINSTHGHCYRCGVRTRPSKGLYNDNGAGFYKTCYDCNSKELEGTHPARGGPVVIDQDTGEVSRRGGGGSPPWLEWQP